MAKPVSLAPGLGSKPAGMVAKLSPAWSVPPTKGFQATIAPSRVAKIKIARPDLLFAGLVNTKSLVPPVLPTTPVGVPGAPSRPGTSTISESCSPLPVYRVENPVPLSLSQTGLVPSCTRPQAFTSFGFVFGATPDSFEVRSVRMYCARLAVGSSHTKRATAVEHFKAFVAFILQFLPCPSSEERWEREKFR